MAKAEHAKALIARGFKIFPIAAGAKAPPCFAGWPHMAGNETGYWDGPDDFNIGIHCEGLVVVDVDIHKGGAASYKQLDDLMDLPATLRVVTPSGGRHVFYRLPEGHPGVPNSVEALGKGLDIRSTGGYVVAPGSRTEAGTYEICLDAPIAPAPAWLVQKLGLSAPRVRPVIADIPDAPEDVVSRAEAWLRGAERSVKGSGGDQAAYRVACALRDQGLSYLQACEAMRSAAWDHGCGWREDWLEAKPIASAYKYAQNDPGVKSVPASAFAAAPAQESAAPERNSKMQVMRLAAFAEQAGKGAGYVIKNVLQRGTYAEIYGAPGEGKTFVALDMAYHVAAGTQWMEHKVRGGPALYLAYEGVGGLVKRAKALRQKYGTADVPLYVVGASFNLREKEGRVSLGEVISAIGEKPVLVVIDTFAHALMGGDENSAQDVGEFNTGVAALIEATGACVMIVHHSGKNKAAGARGSSALLGALDTELEIDSNQIIARKQRDVETGQPISFKLKPVMVGMDSDGDEMTSCTVEPSQRPLPGSKPLTKRHLRALEILDDMNGGEAKNTPIAKIEWGKRLQAEGFSRTAAYDCMAELREPLRKITIEDNMCQRRMQ
jgi:hypothetical protein